MQTILGNEDIIVGVRFPPWPPARRWAFQEFSRRKGDFALAAIALFYDHSPDGNVENAHIGVIGATDIPRRLPAAEAVLNGHRLEDSIILAAAQAAANEVDPPSDLHGSSKYRKSLVATLVKRCLQQTQV
jgi:carbon-monoxide dehydrogenase medium subunit